MTADDRGRSPRQAADEHHNRHADPFDYDAELRRYHQRFRTALHVEADDRVLDIGCGTGQTTREAGRAAVSGCALGVDTSARALARARRLSEEDGLTTVRFEQADAQTHAFPPQRFTLAVSRFGTMFFTDPIAAFTNIAHALRPGARLVQLVWQHGRHQEWDTAVRHALTDRPARPVSAADDPFSLADPPVVEAVLTAAGFTQIGFTDVREPVYYGADTAGACDAVLRLHFARDLLAELDAVQTRHALDRLRATLAAHDTGDGVWFDSRAWIITARRR